MARPTIEEYRESLRSVSNRRLVEMAGSEILAAAVMARFRANDGWHDDCCGAIYAEAARRGNTDIYQRGYNSAVRSQGHHGMAGEVTTPIEHGDPTLVAASEGSVTSTLGVK